MQVILDSFSRARDYCRLAAAFGHDAEHYKDIDRRIFLSGIVVFRYARLPAAMNA